MIQLAHTTPYLGGQVRLDIILDYVSGEGVHTTDLFVAPLSEQISFIDDRERKFLLSDHTENIKYLYNKIQGDFFVDKSKFNNANHWLYNPEYLQDTYDHSYQMGARRMRYQRYDKQFSFLCPIWIESEDDLDNLIFKVAVKGDIRQRTSMIQTFCLSDDIKEYLKTYLKGVNSDLFKMSFEHNSIYITGCEVNTGTILTKDVSYTFKNLLKRERPLMEFDNLIVNTFVNNNIIARQLINLNFVFNVEDLMPASISNTTFLNDWNIELDLYKSSKKVPLKDIWTNYEFISGYTIDRAGGHIDNNVNVLDYLEDYNCVDMLYSNKVTRPLFHWCMIDNPEFIYNFYNGFSPWCDDGQCEGMYCNQPDLRNDVFSLAKNNMNWCKIHDLFDATVLEEDVAYINRSEENFTKIPINNDNVGDVIWINNNKFDYASFSKDCGVYCEGVEHTYVNIVYTNRMMSKTLFEDEYRQMNLPLGDAVYMDNYGNDGNFIIVYDSKIGEDELQNSIYDHYITFAIMQSQEDMATAKYIVDNDMTFASSAITSQYTIIRNFLKYWIEPYQIVFNQSLLTKPIESPIKGTKEFSYIKENDNFYTYLYRYDGKLRPIFIDTHDNKNYVSCVKQWLKKDLNSESVQNYNKLLNTGYDPNYPSVGYYALDTETCDIEQWPTLYNHQDYKGEVTWFNKNKLMFLPIERTITYITDSGPIDENDVWNLLNNEVFGGIDWFDAYIKPLYEYTLDFDYVNKTSLKDIIYTIKYILK